MLPLPGQFTSSLLILGNPRTYERYRMFQCSNGKFIWKYRVCDFDNDCGDNSEESRKDGAFCGIQTCFLYAFKRNLQSNLL